MESSFYDSPINLTRNSRSGLKYSFDHRLTDFRQQHRLGLSRRFRHSLANAAGPNRMGRTPKARAKCLFERYYFGAIDCQLPPPGLLAFRIRSDPRLAKSGICGAPAVTSQQNDTTPPNRHPHFFLRSVPPGLGVGNGTARRSVDQVGLAVGRPYRGATAPLGWRAGARRLRGSGRSGRI